MALLLDRIIPFPTASLAVSPLSYDGGGFVIGGQQLTFGLTNNERAGLEPRTDLSKRLFEISFMTSHTPWWKKYYRSPGSSYPARI